MPIHFDIGKDEDSSLVIVHVITDTKDYAITMSVQTKHSLTLWQRIKIAAKVLFLPKDTVEWNKIELSEEDIKSLSKVLSIYRFVAKKRKEINADSGPVAG